ncbi:hypothetical protein J7E55_23340 [Bacillus sp. ISL-53]|nr:hypothetical protein [Bacillus sp. ISL-53]
MIDEAESSFIYKRSERDEDEKEIESKKNSSLKIKEVESRKESKNVYDVKIIEAIKPIPEPKEMNI